MSALTRSLAPLLIAAALVHGEESIQYSVQDEADAAIHEDTRFLVGVGMLAPIAALGLEVSAQTWGLLPWVFLDGRAGLGLSGQSLRMRGGLGYRSGKTVGTAVETGGSKEKNTTQFFMAQVPAVTGHALYVGVDGERIPDHGETMNAGLLSAGYHYEKSSKARIRHGTVGNTYRSDVAALEVEMTYGVVDGELKSPGAAFSGDLNMAGRWYARLEGGLLWSGENNLTGLRATILLAYKFGMNLAK